jgi:hypothetical protein
MRRERIAIKTDSLVRVNLSEKLPEFRLPGMDGFQVLLHDFTFCRIIILFSAKTHSLYRLMPSGNVPVYVVIPWNDKKMFSRGLGGLA